MATKTFKIGLSNTDKANMSQDIYERVEELLFNEYDPSSTYNTNDYVIYSSVLYRAIADNITGAWDGTKWQSATLNDLVDLVNGAVASVDGKANTEDLLDGALVPNQSVFAKELIPISEERGKTQEEPFILQGTGTDNNTDPVDTGSTAKQLEKQGNTIVYNQLAIIPTLTTRTVNGITFTNNGDGTVTIEGTATADTTFDLMGNLTRNVANHYYLISNFATPGSSTYHLYDAYDSVSDTYRSTPYWYAKQHSGSNTISPRITVKNGTVISTPQTVRVVFVDLAKWFNGDIPQDLLDNPSHFSNYYNGDLDYNLGELINCNGRYLETTGRNLWDEEWELGTYNPTTGAPTVSSDYIRSKNNSPIRIIPNATYYSHNGSNKTMVVLFYDKDDNFISGLNVNVNNTYFVAPANAYYMRFRMQDVYGTTYNHDITISIYYTREQGGEGYEKYYPYEQPKIYDTGTEELLRAGNAKDIKKPDGTIIRNLNIHTFNGNETISVNNTSTDGDDVQWTRYKITWTDYQSGVTNTANAVTDIDKPFVFESSGNTTTGYVISIRDTYIFMIVKTNDYASGTALLNAITNKKLIYELATPTTVQGTPFAENIEINDYGMMSWKDTNNNYVEVPQGCKIFYPAWYVGFIDSLGAKVNWSADNIALNSELNTKFLSFLTSITGYDDTKTQTLKNVTGTLTWVDD